VLLSPSLAIKRFIRNHFSQFGLWAWEGRISFSQKLNAEGFDPLLMAALLVLKK